MQHDAILFDLGGVLIDWNPRYLYRQHFVHDEAMEHFLTHVCPGEWNHEIDAGKRFADAVAERQKLFPEHAELIALWESGWEHMLGEAIPESVAMLQQLKAKGMRLYALTNWSDETFPVARRRFAFLDLFEDIVISGEVKLAKPDPRIFELARTRCRLVPRTTVYIDDAPRNVEAARTLGFEALHFQDPGALRRELVELDLLPPTASSAHAG
jgi:2-haloacid dehalogenase